MSLIFLKEHLRLMENARREHRQAVANIVLQDKNLVRDLVDLTFLIDDEISIKAAWILEWICTHHHLEWLIPYLDNFIRQLPALKFDSAIRPCAKICEQLATEYQHKNNNEMKKSLTQNHIEQLISVGFDWLITPQKTAVKAYTMNTLYLLGMEKDWVHRELKHLIETKIIHQSKGTAARGKHVLKLIEKHQKSHL